MLSMKLLEQGLAAGAMAVVICFLALVLLRLRMDARVRQIEAGHRTLEPVVHSWLVANSDIAQVTQTLRGMPPHAALRSLARVVAAHVPDERQRLIARELRNEPWVAKYLRRANSPFWWRRFDAARLFSVVGVTSDEKMVAQLLRDGMPSVRLVAMDAAARIQSRALVDLELDSLASKQDAVQSYQIAAMTRQPGLLADSLLERIRFDAPEPSLLAWIDAAGALASPRVLLRVRELAAHPAPEIRVRVARALRRLSDPETPRVLIAMLSDEDWRVRAQAARALGALRCEAATAQLSKAVRDHSWWVRYRSALALAQIAGPASAALAELRRSEDAMARDMAVLVTSLSPAAVVEMSEV